jgi:hypothetical protein
MKQKNPKLASAYRRLAYWARRTRILQDQANQRRKAQKGGQRHDR